MSTAYISIGSNMGNRYNYLKGAVEQLTSHSRIEVTAISSIYETDPIGYTDQEPFLNMVIKVNTPLSPHELLLEIQKVENDLGRKREIKWGPRTLDLDILLFNNENIETEKLIIPHPRMHERSFVLVPLMEIDQHIVLPTTKMSISLIIEGLQDREGVRVWKRKSGEDGLGLFES